MLIGYLHQMVIPEDIYVNNITQIERLYLEIYIYVYANVYIFIKTTINKKRGHGSERG